MQKYSAHNQTISLKLRETERLLQHCLVHAKVIGWPFKVLHITPHGWVGGRCCARFLHPTTSSSRGSFPCSHSLQVYSIHSSIKHDTGINRPRQNLTAFDENASVASVVSLWELSFLKRHPAGSKQLKHHPCIFVKATFPLCKSLRLA